MIYSTFLYKYLLQVLLNVMFIIIVDTDTDTQFIPISVALLPTETTPSGLLLRPTPNHTQL